MLRELNTNEMQSTVGGASAAISLGALGNISLEAAIPAVAGVASLVNNVLMSVTGLLGGLV
ncbi:MAG: hypothetical protein ACQER6_01895 [Pseudomonadota bacterium]